MGASCKLMIDRAKFYQITGQRPNFLLCIGYVFQITCGLILLCSFYIMMVQSATLDDVLMYMYGINFLIDIDTEWMWDGNGSHCLNKGTQLAAMNYRWKRKAYKDESTIQATLNRDIFLRKRVVWLTRL